LFVLFQHLFSFSSFK
ncbi:ComEC family competence protein, partial [Haemophilus influenzae]